jgi:hypothetical protein
LRRIGRIARITISSCDPSGDSYRTVLQLIAASTVGGS